MCEFKRLPLADKKYDEITNRICQSYPNSCICWIDEIKNEMLTNEFNKQFNKIAEKRGKNPYVLEMFHGTHEKYIEIISVTGFDITKNKVSAYGKGTYFASDASYSSNYMKPDNKEGLHYMFLCDVLIGSIGVCCTGDIDIEKYDNSVNNKNNISICVTPYNFGAIPKYIIAFYK